jgi:hypothetical protein
MYGGESVIPDVLTGDLEVGWFGDLVSERGDAIMM